MNPNSSVVVEEVDFRSRLDEIRAIRFAVFVDEQKVPAEIEMDQWDESSRHVLATCGGKAVGTGRLLPDGHIGRVAVLRGWRGKGIGVRLMGKLMEMGWEDGFQRLELSSQVRAAKFYESLGFRRQGEIYMEAGIEHVAMSLPAARRSG